MGHNTERRCGKDHWDTKSPWDFKIQTDKQLLANLPDKEQKRTVITDVALLADGNIRKRELEKTKKYHE